MRYVGHDDRQDGSSSAAGSADGMFIGMVNKTDVGPDKKWIQKIGVEDSSISFMLDTGSDVNIISEKEYQSIKPTPKLDKSRAAMTAYSGAPITSIGVCSVTLRFKNRRISTIIEVVRDKCRPALLGGLDCHMLGLEKRVHTMQNDVSGDDETMRREVKKKYPQLFQGTGTLPGVHTIVLKDGATGVVHAPRLFAVTKRKHPKKELDRQVEVGFLAKVNEPTDWANSLVIAEKSNRKMRLCIDPTDLNKEIHREHFQIPTKEDILGKLANASCFSKLDATAGFHQIRLDRPSSLLTTFNTTYGRYRHLILPTGICSAPEVFHKTFHQFLEDCEGTRVYMDDVIVGGSTVEEHDQNLTRTLQKLSEVGLVLNIDKCVFRQAELSYLGEVITNNCVKPDPDKVQAIKDRQTPTKVTELQRVLGLVTFLGRYIPICQREPLHSDNC